MPKLKYKLLRSRVLEMSLWANIINARIRALLHATWRKLDNVLKL